MLFYVISVLRMCERNGERAFESQAHKYLKVYKIKILKVNYKCQYKKKVWCDVSLHDLKMHSHTTQTNSTFFNLPTELNKKVKKKLVLFYTKECVQRDDKKIRRMIFALYYIYMFNSIQLLAKKCSYFFNTRVHHRDDELKKTH